MTARGALFLLAALRLVQLGLVGIGLWLCVSLLLSACAPTVQVYDIWQERSTPL